MFIFTARHNSQFYNIKIFFYVNFCKKPSVFNPNNQATIFFNLFMALYFVFFVNSLNFIPCSLTELSTKIYKRKNLKKFVELFILILTHRMYHSGL